MVHAIIHLNEIHLQWMNIKKIQNLEVFQHLTVLYLQHNCIAKMEGFDHCLRLEYIALNNNVIGVVQNIKHLKSLSGINLSSNQIQEFQGEEFPQGLTVVNMKNNPVCLDCDYKSSLLKKLKTLEMLDEETITPTDKFKILGILPSKVSTYASQVKQFYTKRQIEKRLNEESKPVLFNTEAIDQKEAVGQLRDATRKYKHLNKEGFKQDKAKQEEFFQEKITVSKKIRDIKEKEEKKRNQRLKEIKESNMDKLMK